MPAIAITNRNVTSRGALRQETGAFTDDTTSNYEIYTKLGRIVFFQIQGVGTTLDNEIEAYANSITASATEDDRGVIHVEAGATSAGTYIYRAIGF